MRAEGPLEIRLLGELTVLWNGRAAALPSSRKARALLAYLVMTRVRQSRERLCDLLWDGPCDPRAELRWCLAKLRPVLEADGKRRLSSDREHAAIEASDGVVDVDRVARISTHDAPIEELLDAAALFRGVFLERLELRDCHRFQHWLIAQREAHRTRHLEVLGKIVEHTRNRPEEALAHARAIVAVDPVGEAGHLVVMEILSLLGRKREALEQYETYARVLEAQLGTRPSARVEHARMALSSQHPKPQHSEPEVFAGSPIAASPHLDTPRLPPFVGRQAEVSVIARAVHATTTGGARQVLVLSGEPGIGKSRLLEELARRVRAARGSILAGRGFEAETTRPYGAWVDAIRAFAPPAEMVSSFPDLVTLLPELGPQAGTPGDRTRLFEAVVGLLARIEQDAPLAIVLDDVQWLDEGSVALLHYVARRLQPRRLLLACAARAGELVANAPAWRVLRALGAEPGTQSLTVGPLDPSAVAELTRSVDARLDPEEVFRESQGNSLFALEVARALSEHGTGLSESLEGIIADRIAGLDEGARALVAWAACCGGRVSLDLLARVSGKPAADVLSAIEHLERRAVLRATSGDIYEFAHDLIRQVAYAQMPEPRRRLIHVEIARTLSDLHDAGAADLATAVEIAHHADLGASHGLAAHAAATAGQHCLGVFANTEALTVAVRGLGHLAELRRDERLTLRVTLLGIVTKAVLSDWRRRMPSLESDLEEAVADAGAAGLGDAVTRGRHSLSILHERDDVRVHQDTLLAAEDARGATPETAARQLAYTGYCLAHIQRDMGRARTFLFEAQHRSESLSIEIGGAALGLGIVAMWDGDADVAVAQIERGLQLVRREGDRYLECKGLIYLARIELERNRPREVLVHCAELIPVASGMGEGHEQPLALALQALAHLALGAPDAAATLDDALNALAESDAQAGLAFAANVAAQLDLTDGRVDRARQHAERALHAAERVGRTDEVALARALLARLALASRQRRAARAYLAPVLSYGQDHDALSARTREAIRFVAEQLGIAVPAMPAPVLSGSG